MTFNDGNDDKTDSFRKNVNSDANADQTVKKKSVRGPRNGPTKKQLDSEKQKFDELHLSFKDHYLNVLEDCDTAIPKRSYNSLETIAQIISEKYTTGFAAIAKLQEYIVDIDLLSPTSEDMFYHVDPKEDEETVKHFDKTLRYTTTIGKVTYNFFDLQLKSEVDIISADDLRSLFNL